MAVEDLAYRSDQLVLMHRDLRRPTLTPFLP
jgi:hypothetical protein